MADFSKLSKRLGGKLDKVKKMWYNIGDEKKRR
jgi:hypothetical protein